ncbi:monocarboxylate transporter 12-B-like isoform X2 [Dermacentor albipictus]|uniref:monocarboxylate transporter 12-B-like isoform X2 n=1 Tax=Dermacentor albipictus TaxID=60249 RepID=UPI0031FD1417
MTTGLLEKKGPSSAPGQQQQPQSQPPSNPYQDTFRSWVVGVACAWNFFWLTLVNRSSGILFVAILDVFNVSRQEAAWSFSLMDTMASFTSIGQGMMYFCNTIVINQYFKRHRASGNGIYFAGGTLSSFFFPPMLFSIINTYGLRTTLLFLGAISLNAVPASMLLESPFSRMRRIDRHKKLRLVAVDNECTPEKIKLPVERTAGSSNVEEKLERWFRSQLAVFSFLRRPIFYVIVFTGITFSFSFVVFPVTIVDFAISRGVTRNRAALLLTSFSTGDLVGRLFSGVLTDRKLLRKDHMMVLTYAVWSAAFFALPVCRAYELTFAVTVALGVAVGSGGIFNTVLLADYLGVRVMPTTFAMYRMVLGIISLIRPFFIGYFRDRIGTYDGLYFLLGAYSFLITLIWIVISIVQYCRGTKKYNLK